MATPLPWSVLLCRRAYCRRLAYLLLFLACGLYRLHSPDSVAAGTIVGWGSTNAGELNFPATSNTVVSAAAALNASFLLHPDGTLDALGAVYSGPPMPTDLTNVVSVSSLAAHTLVLRSNGTVAAWGEGFPKAFVPGGISNAVGVAAGFEHSLVLLADGTVLGWGGYWGDTAPGPQTVPPGLSNVVAIAAGGGISLALKDNGSVVTWGGYAAPSDLTNIVAVAGGGYHSLALRSNGTVVAWGDNLTGQLNVPADLTNAIAIAAGWYHSLALTSDGRIVGWGYNHGGQLDVPPGLTNVAAISAGYTHGLAVISDTAPQVYQPPMDYTVIAERTALMVCGASGALPLSYQWRCEGTNVPGATGATLLLTNVQPSQSGLYTVQVVNAGGTVESAAGRLTVVPFVLTSPTNQTMYVGDEVVITVGLDGSGPYTFQWRHDGTNLPSGTNAVLVLPNVTTDDAGSYSVAVTNLYGGMESAEMSLTILDSAPFFVTAPTNIVTWFGANTGFRPVVNGSKPMRMEWWYNGSLLEGATNAALLFDGVKTNQAGTYRLGLTNVLGEALSAPVTLTVVPVAAWGAGWTNLPASLTNAISVAAGGQSHCLALKPNGTVVAWGNAGLVTVPSTVTNVAAIAAATAQSLALRSNGTVVAWNTITTVPANATNITAIAVGGASPAPSACLVLKSNGTVQAWSSGAGGITNSPAGLMGIIGLAAGKYHALALRPDGGVVSWADPTEGRLNAVPTNLTDVVAVAAQSQSSIALRADGTVAAWGRNTYGQTNVPAGLSNVVAVAAGEEHMLALKRDGSLTAWGRNQYGQTNIPVGVSNVVEIRGGAACSLVRLGWSDLEIVRQPAGAPWLPQQPVLLSVGVVSSTPVAYQWQRDGTNLPSGTNAVYRLPALTRAAAGNYRVWVQGASRAVTSAVAQVSVAGSAVVAWGTNFYGQTNVPPGLNAVAVAAGIGHSAALRSDGTVAMWGTTANNLTNIPPAVTNVIAIASGTRHMLALRGDGKVFGWGDGSSGKLAIPSTLSNVRALVAGDTFSAALKLDGRLEQWGGFSVPSSISNVVSLAAGYQHALAARTDGSVTSWGVAAPAVPSWLTNAVAVAAGNNFSVALRANGTVVAWGDNTYGRTNVPAWLTNVVAVSAGQYAAQALRSDGTLVSWGRNYAGVTNVPTALENVLQAAGGELHTLALAGSADPAIVRQMPPTNYAAPSSRVFLSVGAVSSSPLDFQWRRNGTNLIGATNAHLYLPAASANDTGIYSVIASNQMGAVVSSNMFLQVAGYPPAILAQPAGLTNVGGASALFQVGFSGTPPVSFQWRKDSVPIPGAQDFYLFLPELRRTNEGVYSVVASNAFGTVTSSNAVLRVLVPQRLALPGWQPQAGADLQFGDADGGAMPENSSSYFEVQASTNLIHWQGVTNAMILTNGLWWIRDPEATNWSQRFYRVLERP